MVKAAKAQGVFLAWRAEAWVGCAVREQTCFRGAKADIPGAKDDDHDFRGVDGSRAEFNVGIDIQAIGQPRRRLFFGEGQVKPNRHGGRAAKRILRMREDRRSSSSGECGLQLT
jgi:hypothetical protein